MGTGLLITQRSGFRIPARYRFPAVRGHFPSRERGLLRAGHCSKTCSSARALRGLAATGETRWARDETAWTWWTLPPAIAGCPSQRYDGPCDPRQRGATFDGAAICRSAPE